MSQQTEHLDTSGRADLGEARPCVSPAQCSGLAREYVIALAAALVLYLISVAPGPLWQDSGMAQNRVLRHDLFGDLGLALSHPLYYVLAIVFQWLPLTESALKTNLVSALFGAITVANIFLLLRCLTGRRLPAAIGALSLTVAHTFWQHCALAEVYSVSTALMSAELLCLWKFTTTKRARWLVLLALCNGLGVSNHMLAVLNLPAYGIALLCLLARRRLRPLDVLPMLFAWLGGASLYVALIVVELAGGAQPGATLHSALFGTSYANNVLNILPGARQLINSALSIGLNFPTPAILLLLPGAARLWRDRRTLFMPVLGGMLIIHLLWAVRYDVPDQYTFFIPAVVLLSILIGIGAQAWLTTAGTTRRLLTLLAILLPPLVYLFLPPLARAAHLPLGVARELPYRDSYAYFLRPWKTAYVGPLRFAEQVGNMLPDGSILIADLTAVRPFHYLQLTDRWDERIRILPPPEQSRSLAQLTEAEILSELRSGRVFVVSPQPGYCPQWLLDNYAFKRVGPVFQVETPQPRGPDAAADP